MISTSSLLINYIAWSTYASYLYLVCAGDYYNPSFRYTVYDCLQIHRYCAGWIRMGTVQLYYCMDQVQLDISIGLIHSSISHVLIHTITSYLLRYIVN